MESGCLGPGLALFVGPHEFEDVYGSSNVFVWFPSAIYHYLSMVAIHQLTHQHSLQPGALMPVTDRSDLALILMTLVVLAACDGGDGEEM